MKDIILLPLKGIKIYEHTLIIWEDKNNILNFLWTPTHISKWEISWEDTYYFFKNSLQLTFSQYWKLVYIEIFYDLSNNVYLDWFSIFKTDCNNLLKQLRKNYWDFEEEYKWTSYVNYKNSISFWRPSRPEDIEEDLWENDYQKWIYFSVVWIWEKWYFD